LPVVVIQREGGEPLVAVECEVERRRLRRYYQENGVAVYPTVQRALNALARVVAYERKRG
jgi:acyl-CoA synthetase (NDP forming)